MICRSALYRLAKVCYNALNDKIAERQNSMGCEGYDSNIIGIAPTQRVVRYGTGYRMRESVAINNIHDDHIMIIMDAAFDYFEGLAAFQFPSNGMEGSEQRHTLVLEGVEYPACTRFLETMGELVSVD